MPSVQLLLVFLALLSFLVGTISAQLPQSGRVNWVSLGLCFVVLAYLVR